MDIDVHISDQLAALGLICIHIEMNRETEVTIREFQEYLTAFSKFLTETATDIREIGDDLGLSVACSMPQWFPLIKDDRIVERMGITLRVDPPNRTSELLREVIGI